MMKRILILLLLFGLGFVARAQTNPFPTTDSLERFINRWIRNSAVEAFQNLRLNTSLIGMLRFIQNSEIGSGVDTMYLVGGCTVRLTTSGGDTLNISLCGKLDSVTIETATAPNPDTLFEWRGSSRTQVGLIPKVGSGGQMTTIVREPLEVFDGDSALNIPDTLVINMDTVYNILTRAMVVIDTIEFIHSGSNLTTYQSDTLIGAKLTLVFLEDYPVPFLSRSTSVWASFDSVTGTITFTNGYIADDDLVKIIFRHYAIFLVDEDGNLVTDENGNYIILN